MRARLFPKAWRVLGYELLVVERYHAVSIWRLCSIGQIVSAVFCLRAIQASSSFAILEKKPDAMTQLQTALPTLLIQQCTDHAADGSVKVFAQDATRLGLLPVVRRRLTAYGVQPIATVLHSSQSQSLALAGKRGAGLLAGL